MTNSTERDNALARIIQHIQETSEADARILVEELYKDATTNALNRRGILAVLNEHVSSGRPFGIYVGDNMGLKATNDTFGHPTGDDLLRFTKEGLSILTRTKNMKDQERPKDALYFLEREKVGRTGGDEWLGILSDVSTIEDLIVPMTRIVSTFNNQQAPAIALGATLYNLGENPEFTIARADNLMYVAKDKLKNFPGKSGFAYDASQGTSKRDIQIITP